jgi:hypothetical protein
MIYALCPTYGRPELLRNSIACFEAQTYPASRRRLLIGDDGKQLRAQTYGSVEVLTWPTRFQSLPGKFNALAEVALTRGAEILAVWEDDDIYLPHHLQVHQCALARGDYSKPSRILSTYGGTLHELESSGRFHASIAMTCRGYLQVGGWPETKRADFDQQFMSRLRERCGEIDSCAAAPPSYVFRWESTGVPHGQGQMSAPDDETWWNRCARASLPPLPDWRATPKWDAETTRIMDWNATAGSSALANSS